MTIKFLSIALSKTETQGFAIINSKPVINTDKRNPWHDQQLKMIDWCLGANAAQEVKIRGDYLIINSVFHFGHFIGDKFDNNFTLTYLLKKGLKILTLIYHLIFLLYQFTASSYIENKVSNQNLLISFDRPSTAFITYTF